MEAVRTSSVGVIAVKEHSDRLLQRRLAWAKQIESAEADAEKNMPKHLAAVESARAEFEKAQNNFLRTFYTGEHAGQREIARARLNRVRHECTVASLSYSARRDSAAGELRKTCSPLLAEFVGEMMDERGRLRHATPTVGGTLIHSPFGAITGLRRSGSNISLLGQRMAACLAAIRTAEDLMLIPNQGGVAEELAKIRASLPSIESPQ